MPTDPQSQALDLLQELGLKQYEAECFVALTRMPHGTARDVSDVADVPRTRVYDAIDALEERGLVEVQHSNPQQFRAIPIGDAVATLRERFEDRIDRLGDSLVAIEPSTTTPEETTQQVWTLQGSEAISARITELLDEAESEVVAIVGCNEVATGTILDRLAAAADRGADVTIGVLPAVDAAGIRDRIPSAIVFESGLEWLAAEPDDHMTIGRMILVDRGVLLLTAVDESIDGGEESGIWAEGINNGMVVLVRRALRYGLDSLDG